MPDITGTDSDRARFQRLIRSTLDEHVAPHVDEWERNKHMPYREVLPRLARRGLLGIGQPATVGGLGLDDRFSLIWARELGRLPSAVGMALSVQCDIVPPLLACASGDGPTNDLRQAVSGKSVVAYAVTERPGGSDPGNIRTVGERVPGGWTLRGEKTWITNGSIADVIVVAFRTGATGSVADLTLAVVRGDAGGLTRERLDDKLGNRSCDHGNLVLDGVFVPDDDVLAEPGDGYQLMANAFTRERWILAAITSAHARQLIMRTREWAEARQVAAGTLAVQPLFRQATGRFLARAAVLDGAICATVVDGRLRGSLADMSALKLESGILLNEAADWALQSHGATAYMNDLTGPAREVRDARAARLAGGSDEVLADLIALDVPAEFPRCSPQGAVRQR